WELRCPRCPHKRNGPSKENQCKRASAVVQNMLDLSEFHDWRGFPRTKFLREKHGVSTVRYSCLNATIGSTFVARRKTGRDDNLEFDCCKLLITQDLDHAEGGTRT